MTNHQFGLFGFVKPVGKVPISKAQIQLAKDLIAKRDSKGAVAVLRDLRYKLQAFESRISVKSEE
jgi:hypothetical protein